MQTGTIGKLGCGFLFAFHSNYGSILHRLRDKARYWSKIVSLFFHTPLHLTPLLGGPCRNIGCGGVHRFQTSRSRLWMPARSRSDYLKRVVILAVTDSTNTVCHTSLHQLRLSRCLPEAIQILPFLSFIGALIITLLIHTVQNNIRIALFSLSQ